MITNISGSKAYITRWEKQSELLAYYASGRPEDVGTIITAMDTGNVYQINADGFCLTIGDQ